MSWSYLFQDYYYDVISFLQNKEITNSRFIDLWRMKSYSCFKRWNNHQVKQTSFLQFVTVRATSVSEDSKISMFLFSAIKCIWDISECLPEKKKRERSNFLSICWWEQTLCRFPFMNHLTISTCTKESSMPLSN